MTLSLPVAALICLGLSLLDLAVRALRIHLFARGAGQRLSYRDVFILNAFGDAASAATPMRAGGAPARLAGLAHAGVPLPVSLPLVALEGLSYLAVVGTSAAVVGWWIAPGWWAATSPRLLAGLRAMAPWAVLVVVLCVVAVVGGRRMRRRRVRVPRTEAVTAAMRGALGWPLAVSVPLTLLSVAARVAILPVLAQLLPDPPAASTLAVSSFVLIFGQLLIPTPGGVGGVELAFASGAAGAVVPGGTVFWLWRAFVTGVPLLVGFGLGIPRYGGAAVRAALRGREAQPVPAPAPVDTEPLG